MNTSLVLTAVAVTYEMAMYNDILATLMRSLTRSHHLHTLTSIAFSAHKCGIYHHSRSVDLYVCVFSRRRRLNPETCVNYVPRGTISQPNSTTITNATLAICVVEVC